jgi:single-strand DNA-binding protein
MANLNKVMLIGRLTRDPETRHTQGGQSVTSFGLAVNRSYRKKDSNDLVEETAFIDVEAWARRARPSPGT